MALLQPYLPQGGLSTSPFSEGGALYGLPTPQHDSITEPKACLSLLLGSFVLGAVVGGAAVAMYAKGKSTSPAGLAPI